MKYTVHVQRTEYLVVVVEADNEDDAKEKGEEAVNNGEGDVTHENVSVTDAYEGEEDPSDS